MKRVLIFGIAGFVGYYLANEFLYHGYEVIGSDIVEHSMMPSKIEFHKINLLNKEKIEQLIEETSPNMIVNLAAISSVGMSWEMPQTTIEVNLIGAINIMDAAKDIKPLPKVMFIGSSEEYQESDKPISEENQLHANSPYGISKMAQERFSQLYCNRYGMKIYYVRPFNHTGVGQKDTFVLPSFCKQVAEIDKSGKPGKLSVGNLNIARDFSDVGDVVRAYRMIIESEDCGKIFNVGSGKVYTLSKLLEYITSLSSQDISIEVDPARFRPVDNPVICCDYSYIKRELGWEPERSIFDILKEMYEYYRDLH